MSSVDLSDERMDSLHVQWELHVIDWVWMRGSAVAEPIHGKRCIPVLVHGFRP